MKKTWYVILLALLLVLAQMSALAEGTDPTLVEIANGKLQGRWTLIVICMSG